LDFQNKEVDGVFEVSEVQINNEGQIFRGLLYFPAEIFKKPYPLIIYFHGFPQLFSLTEIVKIYDYLLDLGYSFIVFNFRGYRYSEGRISLHSQVSDALKIIEFVEIMARNNIFDIKEINILGYDLGAFIALILCSKIKIINRLILINPIIDLKKHVYSEDFYKSLSYINRFLPGNVKGIENINEFIEYTKEELNNEEFQIEKLINQLDIRKLKIIIGENDRLTPIKEVNRIFKRINIRYELSIIEQMDHECVSEDELKKMNEEIIKYLI
jgi:pimeloyl-ACP methyl ester carboxylesterase